MDEEGSSRIQVGVLLGGDHLRDQVAGGSWRLGGYAVEAAPLDGQLAPLLPVEQLQAGHMGFCNHWPDCTTSLQGAFSCVYMAAEEQAGAPTADEKLPQQGQSSVVVTRRRTGLSLMPH